MAWSLNNETSGEITNIYKDRQLLGDTKLYEIISNGVSSNLTIHGTSFLFETLHSLTFLSLEEFYLTFLFVGMFYLTFQFVGTI